MQKTLLILIVFSLSACDSKPDYETRIYGKLMSIMKQGDLGTRVSLDTLPFADGLYGLGAVTGLKGEIQIFDGKPLISAVNGGTLVVSSQPSTEAALLAYSRVKRWRKVALPKEIFSLTQLDSYLGKIVEEAGYEQLPLPFRIEGQVDSLDWHIIDWPAEDKIHTHEKHRRAGLHGTVKQQAVEIFGYFSDRHQGVLTHHASRIHLHFRSLAENLAGHVDQLEPGRGMTLYLPD